MLETASDSLLPDIADGPINDAEIGHHVTLAGPRVAGMVGGDHGGQSSRRSYPPDTCEIYARQSLRWLTTRTHTASGIEDLYVQRGRLA